jgi:soluble lytic murein transglycosylase-like protein
MNWAFVAALVPSVVAAQDWIYSRPEATAIADYYSGQCAVPKELIYAIIDVESGWKADAVSPKGAVGLMQLMPYTAFRFGGSNRFDTADNLRTGIRYLSFLLEVFDGDLRLAVAAYYAGEARVLRQGLRYRSPDVNEYVRRVAWRYYQHRLGSLSSPGKEETR